MFNSNGCALALDKQQQGLHWPACRSCVSSPAPTPLHWLPALQDASDRTLLLDAQRTEYGRSQADRDAQWDQEQILKFAAQLQDFSAQDAENYKLRAEKMRQACINERQKRIALEKEAKQLRAENAKLKETAGVRIAAPRPSSRWRNMFRASGLHAINEEPEDQSSADELSSLPSSASDKTPEAAPEAAKQPDPEPLWAWDALTVSRFRAWVTIAAGILALLLLIALLVLLVPPKPPRPLFTVAPALVDTSVTGHSFSIDLAVDTKASIRYIAVERSAFLSAARQWDLDEGSVADATQLGSTSALAQVCCALLLRQGCIGMAFLH